MRDRCILWNKYQQNAEQSLITEAVHCDKWPAMKVRMIQAYAHFTLLKSQA